MAELNIKFYLDWKLSEHKPSEIETIVLAKAFGEALNIEIVRAHGVARYKLVNDKLWLSENKVREHLLPICEEYKRQPYLTMEKYDLNFR